MIDAMWVWIANLTRIGSDIISVMNWLRRMFCKLAGHRRHKASFGTIGAEICGRCLEIVKVKTVRRTVTKGDMQRQIAALAPAGFSFVSFKSKKRTAKFVGPGGTLTYVSI